MLTPSARQSAVAPLGTTTAEFEAIVRQNLVDIDALVDTMPGDEENAHPAR